MANIKALNGVTYAKRGEFNRLFHFYTPDTFAAVEAPGYLNAYDMPGGVAYVGDMIEFVGPDWTQEYAITAINDETKIVTIAKVGGYDNAGGPGASQITDLSDTPGTLGAAGEILQMNAAGTALEFVPPPSSAQPRVVSAALDAFNNLVMTRDDASTFQTNMSALSKISDITNLNGNPMQNPLFQHDDGDGNVEIISETVTTFVDNLDGTFTYTNEQGVPNVLTIADTHMMSNDLAGTADRNHTTTANWQIVRAGMFSFELTNGLVRLTYLPGGNYLIGPNGHEFNFAAGADLRLDTDPGTMGQVLTSQGPDNAPIWGGMAISVLENLAAMPNPTTVPTGTVYSVVNDGVNTGLWQVTGPTGGNGTGVSRV